MRKIYKLVAFLLLAGRVAAQAPAPPTQPTTFRSGSYQLVVGDWKRAKLLYDEHTLSVSDAEHKPKYPLVYPADSVRAFAIGRDTFEVVHGVDIPKPAQHLRSTFARHLYRSAGFQVAEYVAFPTPPEAPVVYTLLTSPGKLVVLPPNARQFRLTLAAAMRDYSALATQLELDPQIVPEQLPQLLAAYGHWKASGAKK